MLLALGGAREALSFSSTRLRHTTGKHLHRINHYPKVAGMSIPGQCIESAPFVVGGHEWQLHFYPNGAVDSVKSGSRAAVNVVLRGGPWWKPFYASRNVTAAYQVSVLDGDGNRVLSRAVGPRRFSEWECAGAKALALATAEELRSAAMRGWKDSDGELVVRCDLTVTSIEEESRVRLCIRQLVSKLN